MQRIKRADAMKYEFDHRDEPLLRVQQGESFVIETMDAGSGYFKTADDLPIRERMPTHKDAEPGKGNPIGGPRYVEGAQPGDLLAVKIEDIVVGEQGWTAIFAGSGPFGESTEYPELTGPYTHIIRHDPGPSGTTRDGMAIVTDDLSWPLRPFIGTIGVAPQREVETSAVGQGPWGGNLDCRDVCPGHTFLVNVYHEGALLYIGDVHGSQGDTESYGAADETQADVQLSCTVLKNKRIEFLRIDKPESIVSVYCFRPLEVAVESAMKDLVRWLIQEYNIPPRIAYIHTCCNPDFRINVYQMVRIGRIQYTVGAELPKKYLA